MNITERYHVEFSKRKQQDIRRVFCPYRVCPIGAHSDHQYGLVTGFAMDKGVELLFTITDNGIVDIVSCDFEGHMQFHVDDIPPRQGDWGDYLRGAVESLVKEHDLHHGIRGVVAGSLPVGGLSSSAAVTLTYLLALCQANNIQLSSTQLINYALHAENHYVGVNVGKLDQSCEVLSRKNHLLYLDTKTDQYELIPRCINAPEHEIAIFFSGVPRSLVGTAFNARVDECKAAAYSLMALEGMEYGRFDDARLRDVPEDVFRKWEHKLPLNFAKRANHFYSEFNRVKLGAEAWRDGDLKTFGDMIFKSGQSSIYNFETGSPELKLLYEIMIDVPGIYGGRFSGAGFKGCCMALIDPKYRGQITERVTQLYTDAFPSLKDSFSIHFCHSDDGARLIT